MSTLFTGELIVAKWSEIQKHLKVQWDIDDADEVQEITAAKTPMKKYDKWIQTNLVRKSILSSGEIIVVEKEELIMKKCVENQEI